MKQSTLKWSIVGDVCVSCVTEGRIAEDAWRAHLEALAAPAITMALTSALGPIDVDGTHRKQVADLVAHKGMRTVMVTDERMVRGLATAISWLGVDIKAYSWVDVRDAIAHLKSSRPEQERLLEALMDVRRACQAAETTAKTGVRGR
jgi:hypothetical protein